MYLEAASLSYSAGVVSDKEGTPSPVRKLLLNLAREEWLAKFAALPF
jgi:hypothetical protein